MFVTLSMSEKLIFIPPIVRSFFSFILLHVMYLLTIERERNIFLVYHRRLFSLDVILLMEKLIDEKINDWEEELVGIK